jgi:uncharacterized protein GlcG (DUF336 family)
MRKLVTLTAGALLAGVLSLGSSPAFSDKGGIPHEYESVADCSGLPSYSDLTTALKNNVSASGGPSNGGLDFHMWATIVNRDGQVCAVTRTGDDRGDQWPGSRVISAQKAYTANAFSLPGFALSTANLFSAVQAGQGLFGLQFSNPVDTAVAYGDDPGDHKGADAENYGTADDPLVGEIMGGVNVFGGGLALYENDGTTLIGALGVSGDTSCADHNVAWRVREELVLDFVPNGPNSGDDGIIYDTTVDGGTGHTTSASGFGHVDCGNGEASVADAIGAGTCVTVVCP